MGIEPAARWVRDCLNSDRPERFDPEQVLCLLRLAKDQGVHSGKFWLDAELGYEQGRPLSPEDEKAALQREYIETVHAAKDIVDRMERLARSPLAVAK